MQRRYKRYFVMLEEEDKGFSSSKSDTVKGYGKIEIRNDHGTLSLYCQNLKKLEEKKERYRLYLILTEDPLEPTVVDIGPIKVDDNGKGEIVWEFNSENVKGFKKPIEDFDVLTIVVEPFEETQRILAPLVGYIHKKKSNWKPLLQKKLFVVSKDNKKQVQLQPQEKSVQIDIATKNPLEEKPKLVEETNSLVGYQKEPMEKANEKIKEEVKEEVKKDKAKEIKEETNKKIDEKIKQENLHVSDKTYLNKNPQTEVHPLQKYVENTLKAFPKVEPFGKNLKDYEWWQIYYNNQTSYRAYMPYVSHIEAMMNPYYYHYPYYSSSDYQRQLYRYQHHIFGICYDENKKAKYFVYGIPGKRTSLDQPYTGRTGFVYWHACNYEPFKQEGLGYWLMHINAKTGKVEEPLTATEL